MPIGIFYFLVWQLDLIVTTPIKDDGVFLLVQGLIEIAFMVIIARRFGDRNVAQDIIELGVYALLVHLIAIPAYYMRIPSEFHNYAIWLLCFVVIGRLMYFGPKTQNNDYKGMPVFGLYGHIKKLIQVKDDDGKVSTWLPVVLFYGSTIPLAFIIARTNVSVVAATAVGLMLFLFIVSKKIGKAAVPGFDDADVITLCKIFNARSPEAKNLILKFAATEFNIAEHDDFFETKKMTDEAIRLMELLRKEMGQKLTYQEIMMVTSFKYLPKEKQQYILTDTNLARLSKQMQIAKETAEADARMAKFRKHMKWKFYSGTLPPGRRGS